MTVQLVEVSKAQLLKERSVAFRHQSISIMENEKKKLKSKSEGKVSVLVLGGSGATGQVRFSSSQNKNDYESFIKDFFCYLYCDFVLIFTA